MISADDPEFLVVEAIAEEPKQAIKKEAEKKQPENTDTAWTNEEITLLTKALVKFPVGTRDRYKHVSEFIGTRSMKEVIKQTNIGKSETAQG